MAVRTSVTTDAAGRRVLAKVAANAEEAFRLAHEAAQLEAARHPGVVELVGVDGHGVGSILLTAHVEGPTLAQTGRLPLEESAGLLAALATTLADLHDLGLVHGGVVPEHVIVGPGGRPVLCGLAYGGRAGEAAGPLPPVAAAFADPARTGADVLSPAFDVFELGVVVHTAHRLDHHHRRRDCPVASAVLQADVDGDGCPEALRYADGVLEAGAIRWALGRSGDQVATGDWSCQGARTLALFRPSTGEVFRFDGWAAPGTDLQAVPVGRVQGGLVLRAADVDRDGCHEAVVERATGPAEVLRLVRP